ncbi:MAG TPA: VanZ family protein [Gemmataceae bacterium]|jgi:VanZ family protein
MADTEDRERRRKLLVRGLGWCVCVGVWTAALLTTYPVEIGEAVAPDGLYFPAAKTLHVCAYAFLAVYTSWLPLRRGRWWLLAFLSLHAAGTEFGQLFIPGRVGNWIDVLIDHAGLLLGLALTWKRWVPRSVRRSAPYGPRQAGGYGNERVTSSLP